MTISRTNIVLAALLLGVMMLAATTRVDYSQPNIEILPDMKYTPAWTAYAENPNFPNGRTLQAPVPGTIARGEKPLHYAATPEDAVRAGEGILNPYAVEIGAVDEQDTTDGDSQDGELSAADERAKKIAEVQQRLRDSTQRGSEIYRVFCIPCHGPSGAGDGLVATRGFPPPPSLLTGKSPQMKDGQLFHILTYGQGSMSPMVAQLSPERRWNVINYIRSMQASAPPPDSSAAVPDALPAEDAPPQSDAVATEAPDSQPESKGSDNDE